MNTYLKNDSFNKKIDKKIIIFGITIISIFTIYNYLKISTKENNFIKVYALDCAKNNIKSNFVKAIKATKGLSLITIFDRIEIFMMYCYGKIRPLIRRLYYRIFRNIKTN